MRLYSRCNSEKNRRSKLGKTGFVTAPSIIFKFSFFTTLISSNVVAGRRKTQAYSMISTTLIAVSISVNTHFIFRKLTTGISCRKRAYRPRLFVAVSIGKSTMASLKTDVLAVRLYTIVRQLFSMFPVFTVNYHTTVSRMEYHHCCHPF